MTSRDNASTRRASIWNDGDAILRDIESLLSCSPTPWSPVDNYQLPIGKEDQNPAAVTGEFASETESPQTHGHLHARDGDALNSQTANSCALIQCAMHPASLMPLTCGMHVVSNLGSAYQMWLLLGAPILPSFFFVCWQRSSDSAWAGNNMICDYAYVQWMHIPNIKKRQCHVRMRCVVLWRFCQACS